MPEAVQAMIDAGLDSIRISLNSAQKDLYNSYYRPKKYSFEDIIESALVAKRNKKWVSLNYFVFPGITDSADEYEALRKILSDIKPDMIQWRNFNTDPEFYLKLHKKIASTSIGMKTLLTKIHKEFPFIRFGYFNPFL